MGSSDPKHCCAEFKSLRPELKRLILNARARLGGYELPAGQAEENTRRQAIEEFKILLAGRIDTTTRLELLLGGEYVWLQTGPAVRFGIDGHTFVIAGADEECQLWDQHGGELLQPACLAVSDPSFEDRLLAAIGAALDAVRQ